MTKTEIIALKTRLKTEITAALKKHGKFIAADTDIDSTIDDLIRITEDKNIPEKTVKLSRKDAETQLEPAAYSAFFTLDKNYNLEIDILAQNKERDNLPKGEAAPPGAYGSLKYCRKINDNDDAQVVKTINLKNKRYPEKELTLINNEVNIMRISGIDVKYRIRRTRDGFFKCYIITDYLGENLHSAILNNINNNNKKLIVKYTDQNTNTINYIPVISDNKFIHPFTNEEKIIICLSASKSLETFHARGYKHADIKTENLVLAFLRVQLIDFGYSCKGLGDVKDYECQATAIMLPKARAKELISNNLTYLTIKQENDIKAMAFALLELFGYSRKIRLNKNNNTPNPDQEYKDVLSEIIKHEDHDLLSNFANISNDNLKLIYLLHQILNNERTSVTKEIEQLRDEALDKIPSKILKSFIINIRNLITSKTNNQENLNYVYYYIIQDMIIGHILVYYKDINTLINKLNDALAHIIKKILPKIENIDFATKLKNLIELYTKYLLPNNNDHVVIHNILYLASCNQGNNTIFSANTSQEIIACNNKMVTQKKYINQMPYINTLHKQIIKQDMGTLIAGTVLIFAGIILPLAIIITTHGAGIPLAMIVMKAFLSMTPSLICGSMMINSSIYGRPLQEQVFNNMISVNKNYQQKATP